MNIVVNLGIIFFTLEATGIDAVIGNILVIYIIMDINTGLANLDFVLRASIKRAFIDQAHILHDANRIGI